MRRIFPVSAKRLYKRNACVGGMLWEGASLFPLFDCEGKVREVMFAREDSAQVYLASWEPNRFQVPLFGKMNLELGDWFPLPVSETGVERIQGLWHYDPWWILDEARYGSFAWMAQFKATNCVGSCETVSSVYFTSGLQRVWAVNTVDPKTSAHSVSFEYKKSVLPQSPSQAPPLRDAASDNPIGWRLAPMWESHIGGRAI